MASNNVSHQITCSSSTLALSVLLLLLLSSTSIISSVSSATTTTTTTKTSITKSNASSVVGGSNNNNNNISAKAYVDPKTSNATAALTTAPAPSSSLASPTAIDNDDNNNNTSIINNDNNEDTSTNEAPANNVTEATAKSNDAADNDDDDDGDVSKTKEGDDDDDGEDEDEDVEEDGEVEEEEEEDLTPRFSMETFVTIVVTLMVVLSNCSIIMVAAWTDAFNNFNKIFMYSMTLADLLVGLFITPYSIFLSIYRRWVFAGDTFCNIEAYFLMCLSGAKLFSLTWLNVDHYIAVRKPERYGVMMSQTRSLCWVFFCWLAPISFCIPPIFHMKSSVFNDAVYVCQANATVQIAYVATAGSLVSLPAFVALVVTNVYLFTKSYKTNIQFYEKVFVELSTRPWKYRTTFVMCTVCFAMWMPYIIVFCINLMDGGIRHDKVHFYFFWLGVSSCSANFFVLLAMCHDFRQAVRELYRVSGWCPLCRRRARNRRYHYESDVNVITFRKK